MEVWAGPRLTASLGCLPSVTCGCLTHVFKANINQSLESLVSLSPFLEVTGIFLSLSFARTNDHTDGPPV